jgi:tRNA-splicing endonuclease subunit Sen54
MDDLLEQPGAAPDPIESSDRLDADEENSSGDEDDGLDWTKLPTGAGRPVIPKRGEKDFEPSAGGGSGLQLHVLDHARSAMFYALKATPSASSKSISYAIWHPGIARAHVTLARGVHFSSVGHSAPRIVWKEGEASKIHKRLELLPEEALYLVERGTLFCTKESPTLKSNVPGSEDIEGAPMSVQQAFAEMIGTEDLSLEKYQVFAYLKRLGFSVARTEPPTPCYPSARPYATHNRLPSVLQRLYSWLPSWMHRFRRLLTSSFNWWSPLRLSGLYHDKDYPSVFKSLRFLPSGHAVPLQTTQKTQTEVSSPYNIFFNLYKPSTPFRKSAPGPPDFSLVVVNARTTPMPSLYELTELFDVLPELPPPQPRQRRSTPNKTSTEPPKMAPSTASAPTAQQSLMRRLFPWAFWSEQASTGKPNPFMVLKSGKKQVVVAAVDAGSISFFRFGQGAFEELPMA